MALSPKRLPSLALAVSALLLFPLLCHLPALLLGQIPFFMDTVMHNYPLRMHAAELLHQGEWPFWNRTLFAGVPLLANIQHGLLYPGHLPFWLVPGPRSYTLVNVLHITWMGMGMFFWLRRRQRGGVAAPLLAGLLLQAGGWTWAHLAFVSYLQVGAWFPWVLWCGESWFQQESRRWQWLVLSGLCSAMMVLAGAPQLALYCQGGLFLYMPARGLKEPKAWKGALEGALFSGAQGLFALGLSAAQWLPTWHFMQEATRVDSLSLQTVQAGALNLRQMLAAWIGGTGRPEDAGHILYPGIGAMLLMAAGLAVRPRKQTLPLLAVGLATLLFAWRGLAPVLYKVCPLYDAFHDPRRALFIALVPALALAGAGFHWLHHKRPLLATLLFALILAEPLVFSILRVDIKTGPPPEKPALEMPEGARFFAIDSGIQYSYNYTRPNLAASLLPNLGALYGWEDIQGYDPVIPWRYSVYMRRLNGNRVTLYPRHFGLVRNVDSPWLGRFGPLYVRGPLHYHWPFMPPRWVGPGETFSLSLRGSLALAPGKPRLLAATLQQGDGLAALSCRLHLQGEPTPTLLVYNGPKADAQPLLHQPVLPDPRLTAVYPLQTTDAVTTRHLITSVTFENPGHAPLLVYSIGLPRDLGTFEPASAPGLFRTFEGEPFPDRIILRKSTEPAPSERETYARHAMRQRSNVSVVELPPDWEAPLPPARKIEGVKIRKIRNDWLRLDLPKGHGGGWALVQEPFAPGWSCRANDKRLPVFAVDTLFRAVPVPAGVTALEMRYLPPGLLPGLWITAASLVLGGGMMARQKWVRKRGVRS